MQRSCKNCDAVFEVTPEDLGFYEKVSPIYQGKKYLIPPPTFCPDCRQQRRFAFRNERKLYRRKCDLTEKEILSFYSSEGSYPIHETSAWWSDQWDAHSFARSFDFSRSFFAQFDALLHVVPKMSLVLMNAENVAFSNFCVGYKNAYMCVSGVDSENVYYTYFVNRSRDCMDCSLLLRSELCYDCVCSDHLYHCITCFECENLSDCILCFDCKSCKNCIGCVGLRNKEYCILNQECGKNVFEEKKQDLEQNFHRVTKDLLPHFLAFKRKHPHLYAVLTNSENCTGNFIYNSKNVHHSFDVTDSEDCTYCTNILFSKDCRDCHYFPRGELMYEAISSSRPSHQSFCFACWESHRLLYCHECMSSKDCFGCAGLKNAQHCIFNKQYSKEEYEVLVPRIIEHMQQCGEYGEFFPVSLSPFAYNETIAQEYIPLSKEEVLTRGWKWWDATDEVPKVEKFVAARELSDSIQDTSDDILTVAIQCEATGRPFKIIKQELEFYRKMHLPLPHLHPDERHRRRMALRNPRKLWKRACMKCGEEMQTSYAPERPETVYCESCYLQSVY